MSDVTSYSVRIAAAHAESMAKRSPCMKSKRGTVIYSIREGWSPYIDVHSAGYNGMPDGLHCTGSAACRADCNKRCVHAEMRALRNLPAMAGSRPSGATRDLYLLHVELDDDGKLVAGKAPCCWQCSREILDGGRIAGVWLYERSDTEWHCYTPLEFHSRTLVNTGLDQWGLA